MKKLVLLMMIVCMAIPCFAGSPFNIWTRPDADWLTGQTPNFDPAWAWMKWMDGMVSPPGDVFYVDGINGAATNDGLSWNRAKATIAQGLGLVSSRYSTVYVGGVTYTESVSLPAFSCGRLIGVTHADNIPEWLSNSGAESHLTMGSGGWEVAGFRFHGTTNTAPYIKVTGHHHIIRDNWFSGVTAKMGIQFSGGPTVCKILRNRFNGFTTGGIWDGAIGGENYVQAAVFFEIIDNFFANNTKNINLLMNACLVKGNSFTTADGYSATTIIISTYSAVGPGSGGGGGNVITENRFPHKTYEINAANGYEGSTSDNWMGNYCSDGLTIETYPRAGTTLIEQDSITPKIYLTSTITSAMTAGNGYGSGDSPVMFTVTGDILCRAFAIVKTSVTSNGNTGELALGIAGTTGCLFPLDVIQGSGYWDAGDVATFTIPATIDNAVLLPTDWIIIANGADIILTVTTQPMTAGIVMFNLEWKPLSADAQVVGAAP